MVLALPRASVAIEGQPVVEINPRHIYARQPPPLVVALGGSELRPLIDDVLEVVHHRAVGDKGQRAGEMGIQELARVGAEEALRPRPREKLHGHRVHLAGLHRRPLAGGGHDEASGIVGEGVAGLMRDDLHIAGGAVEVGENERRAVVRQARAVAAAGLALAREHVEKSAVEHEVDELRRFRRELVIEFSALRENVLGAALRPCVAGAELERGVRIAHREALAQSRGLTAVDALGKRNYIPDDGGAEALHVVFVIAVAGHAAVAETGVAPEAELFAHAVAQLHELVVYPVEPVAVLHIPLALGSPRGGAARIVRVLLEGRELRDRVDPALKGDLRRGEELGILGGERVLALELRYYLAGKGLLRHLCVHEHHGAVFLREFLSERRCEQRLYPPLRALLKQRRGLVGESDLGVVKLVGGVDVVADMREREHRLHRGVESLDLAENGVSLVKGGGGGKSLRRRVYPCPDALYVGALVFKSGKLHLQQLLNSTLRPLRQYPR